MVRRTGSFLTIEVDSKRVENLMNNLKQELPKGLDIGVKKVAGMYAGIYLEQVNIAEITRWTGRSFNILKRQKDNPQRIGRGYGVIVPSNLIALDQLQQPHIVALKRGRSITRWARAKLGLEGRVLTHLAIKRHPWLTNANRRARKRVKRKIEIEMDKRLRRSKR